MSIEENVQTVKSFFEAMGSGDKHKLLALASGDIEWFIPGKNWLLAGTYHGHSGLEELLRKISQTEITRPSPPQFVAQGNKVIVGGVAEGRVKATNKRFIDDWVFAITVENGKLTAIKEYIDTQALAEASAE